MRTYYTLQSARNENTVKNLDLKKKNFAHKQFIQRKVI